MLSGAQERRAARRHPTPIGSRLSHRRGPPPRQRPAWLGHSFGGDANEPPPRRPVLRRDVHQRVHVVFRPSTTTVRAITRSRSEDPKRGAEQTLESGAFQKTPDGRSSGRLASAVALAWLPWARYRTRGHDSAPTRDLGECFWLRTTMRSPRR